MNWSATGPTPDLWQSAVHPIRVLIVEADPADGATHRRYVQQVPGFAVCASARTATEARHLIHRTQPHLLLLDLDLPDVHGLDLVRWLRTATHGDAGKAAIDVMVVSSARDLSVVRQGVSLGVLQYLLKPFTYATLRDRLLRYAEFRAAAGEAAGQEEVDRALANLRGPHPSRLPKGLVGATLAAVARALRDAESPDTGLTATEAGAAAGVSRITARRYLEHLVATGRARRVPRYGQVGRPELIYHWLPENDVRDRRVPAGRLQQRRDVPGRRHPHCCATREVSA